MTRFVDDFPDPSEDRRATVDKLLTKAGIDRDGKPAPPPISAATRNRLAAMDEREGFVHPPRSWPISQTMAEQLHYRPAVPRFTAGDVDSRDD